MFVFGVFLVRFFRPSFFAFIFNFTSKNDGANSNILKLAEKKIAVAFYIKFYCAKFCKIIIFGKGDLRFTDCIGKTEKETEISLI